MTPGATKYPLGLGPFAVLLVFLMLAGASAFFASAYEAGEATELVVLGNVIAGPATSLRLMFALAVLFGAAALYLLVRSARNFGNAQYVMLDANLIEISGLDLDGVRRTVTYAEIVSILDYKVQGVASVEIKLRDGTSLNFAEAQFRTRAQYQQFRNDLESRLPALLNRLSLAALLLISVGTVPAIAAGGNEGLTLGAVRAHQFYEHSGEFSEDLVARQPRFRGWNTDEGEVDAKEPSRNLFVAATLVNPGEKTWLSENVRLRVTDEIDAEVKSRAFREIRVPERGTLQLPIWIDDAACLGTVTISATFRDRTVSGTLDLPCGT